MKFILVLLFVLQLIGVIQSQSDDGYGGSPSDSVQPSYPVTTAGPSQTSDGGNNSPSNGPTATSQTAGQTSQASVSSDNTSLTSMESSTYSSTTHTRNSATQTANPTTTGNGTTNFSDSGSSSSDSDNVGAIAGGVVGGVVGLALIGGLLAWLNRRGGCTSRSKRRRHDTTFDDFAFHTDDSSGRNNNSTPGANSTTTGDGDDSSPFQRRMVPMAQNNYMNLGNTSGDDYSETTTAVPLSGYPKAAIHDSFKQHPSDSYYGYANNQLLDPWQHYSDSATSPQTPNTYDRRVKPDAVDYKPHQI